MSAYLRRFFAYDVARRVPALREPHPQGGIGLKGLPEERAVSLGLYMIENNATVRSAAKAFHISKSTVHKDVTERLPAIDHTLADEVRTVLNVNKAERHIRGGLATKEKYLHAHEDCTD